MDLGPKTLCSKVWLEKDIRPYEELIEKGYGWAPKIDRLPAALRLVADEAGSDDDGKSELRYNMNVPLGYQDNSSGTYYINNHVNMLVKLAPTPNKE